MSGRNAAHVLGFALLSLGLLAAGPASSAVTVYTSLAAFQAAAPGATLGTDLESHATGAVGTFSLGCLTFSSTLNNMYIIGPTAPGTTVPLPPSHMLSANGQENIFMTPDGGPIMAFGFTLLTNVYGPGTLTLYDGGGSVFFTYNPTQAANTIGFVGLVSDTPISKARWVASHGELQNTALDDFYLDPVCSSPVRTGTWGWIKGLYR